MGEDTYGAAPLKQLVYENTYRIGPEASSSILRSSAPGTLPTAIEATRLPSAA